MGRRDRAAERRGTIEDQRRRAVRRDTERIDAYYRDLLRQIEKRLSRRTADLQAAGKERSRAAATQLDRAAKLDDHVIAVVRDQRHTAVVINLGIVTDGLNRFLHSFKIIRG